MRKHRKLLYSFALSTITMTLIFNPNLSKAEKNIKKNINLSKKSPNGFKSDKYLNEIKNIYDSNEKNSKNKKESSKNDMLSKKINNIISEESKKLDGNWQIAVDTIKGKSNISIERKSDSKNEALPSASTIKIFIGLEAYRQVESGILKEENVGNDIYLMLKDSNNEATNRLIDLIGNNNMEKASKNVGEIIKKITGKNRTTLYRKMLQDGKENMTNAKDLNMALKAIYYGKIVNRDHSNKLMKAMAENNSTSNFKLLAKLPKSAKCLNKSGELPNIGVENDAALIGVGEDIFAISFLSQNSKPVEDGSGPQFDAMQNLGKKISEAFIEFGEKNNWVLKV